MLANNPWFHHQSKCYRNKNCINQDGKPIKRSIFHMLWNSNCDMERKIWTENLIGATYNNKFIRSMQNFPPIQNVNKSRKIKYFKYLMIWITVTPYRPAPLLLKIWKNFNLYSYKVAHTHTHIQPPPRKHTQTLYMQLFNRGEIKYTPQQCHQIREFFPLWSFSSFRMVGREIRSWDESFSTRLLMKGLCVRYVREGVWPTGVCLHTHTHTHTQQVDGLSVHSLPAKGISGLTIAIVWGFGGQFEFWEQTNVCIFMSFLSLR